MRLHALSGLPRVLFVDDQPEVLISINRGLLGRYEVSFAGSGEEGLRYLEKNVYDVIVSDLRMPGLSGEAFLKAAAQRQPNAVRLVLSGQSDLKLVVAAVNEGSIFRFLFKPFNQEQLFVALRAAVEQRRLVRAEKDLLEHTLTGAVNALTETLELMNPTAFTRGRRLRRIVALLAREVGLENTWALEIAALLSQLGSVSLPPEVAQRWHRGAPLSEDELKMVGRCHDVTRRVLSRIPRLESVVALIEPQSTRPPSIEAEVMRVAIALDAALAEFRRFEQALEALATDPTLDAAVVARCGSLRAFLEGKRKSVALHGLREGMLLAEDVRSSAGALLIAGGHEVTQSLLARLQNFAATAPVQEPILVTIPANDPDFPERQPNTLRSAISSELAL